MNDPPLGRLIDCGDERAHLISVRSCRRTCPLLLGAQLRDDTPIAERALHCLAGAFGGRFCVSHLLREKLWAWTLAAPARNVKKIRRSIGAARESRLSSRT